MQGPPLQPDPDAGRKGKICNVRTHARLERRRHTNEPALRQSVSVQANISLIWPMCPHTQPMKQ